SIPFTPLPAYPEKTRRKRHSLPLIFSLLLVLLLGGSGLLAWTYIPQLHPAPVATPTSPATNKQSTSTPQHVTTPTLPAAPVPLINAGQLLYQDATLSSACSSDKNAWSLDTNAQVICRIDGAVLRNTTGHYLSTMFLNSINGYGIPNDY